MFVRGIQTIPVTMVVSIFTGATGYTIRNNYIMGNFTRGSGGGTGPDSHAVAKLGYPPAQPGRDGTIQWFVQETADSLKYCVCVASRRTAEATLLAVTVTSSNDGPEPLQLARQRVAARAQGGDARPGRTERTGWRPGSGGCRSVLAPPGSARAPGGGP